MGTLSTKLRCNGCGSRLLDETVVECPDCHAKIAEVGIWSELREWGKTRQMGRGRFIRQHVVRWGGLMTLGNFLGCYIRGDVKWPVYVFILSANLTGGFFFGRYLWRSAEDEFEAADQKGRISLDP